MSAELLLKKKKDMAIDSNMIQEKAKSLYDKLKQKEDERSEAEEFHVSKR